MSALGAGSEHLVTRQLAIPTSPPTPPPPLSETRIGMRALSETRIGAGAWTGAGTKSGTEIEGEDDGLTETILMRRRAMLTTAPTRPGPLTLAAVAASHASFKGPLRVRNSSMLRDTRAIPTPSCFAPHRSIVIAGYLDQEVPSQLNRGGNLLDRVVRGWHTPQHRVV
jgi:hypothetical protein